MTVGHHGADSVTVEALLQVLRPLVAQLVEEELARHELGDHRRDRDDSFLTTAEYAERFKTTPGAVLARIRRGTLKAVRPPGSREWLISIDDDGYDETQ